MRTGTDLGSLAARLVEAQDGHVQLAAISASGCELSMHEAYEVSWLVHEERLRRGWKPVGRKIGFTNRAMWSMFGVRQPVWSFVYDTTCEAIGGTHRCALAGLVQPRIEPEIVFGLRAAPSVGAGAQEMLDGIAWMAHGIEMVQCHYPDWKFDSTDAVCDASFHGRLLVGDRRAVPTDHADACAMLEACEVRLYRGDELVETGHGRNVLDSPLLALASLVEAIDREGGAYPLLPGEMITTGTMTRAYAVGAGQRWRTEFDRAEFPGLAVQFI